MGLNVKIKIGVGIGILVILIMFVATERSNTGSKLQNSQETSQEEVQMRVEFYKIDRERASAGEYVGYAELRGNHLYLEIKDEKLKQILNSPYQTMKGEVEGSMIVDKIVTLQPGTLEHLRAIAIESWQYGYIGKIVKQ